MVRVTSHRGRDGRERAYFILHTGYLALKHFQTAHLHITIRIPPHPRSFDTRLILMLTYHGALFVRNTFLVRYRKLFFRHWISVSSTKESFNYQVS